MRNDATTLPEHPTYHSSASHTAILLTASIVATRSSNMMTEMTRRDQYEWSVRGWCRILQNYSRIALVAVENTDANVTSLVDAMRACRQPHEVVRAPKTRSPCKGHGEMESILHARKTSLVLSRAERIVKVTGRYVLPDLPRHLDGDWMALRQNALLPGMHGSVHCEIVGAHRSVFDSLFSRKTRLCHVEKVYEARFRAMANVSRDVPPEDFPTNAVVKRLPPLSAEVLPAGRYEARMWL